MFNNMNVITKTENNSKWNANGITTMVEIFITVSVFQNMPCHY